MSDLPVLRTNLPVIGSGKQATVYGIIGKDLAIKVFDRGSENDRLQGLIDQAYFLSYNSDNPAVPRLVKSGILASGDPYIIMSKLPSDLERYRVRSRAAVSTAIIRAAEDLRPHGYIWTDVYNNAWTDSYGRVYFNEGGRYTPENPFNGGYNALGRR